MRDDAPFYKRLLAREDTSEIEEGRSPGKGVPFSWEDKPGSRRDNVGATEDLLQPRILPSPPLSKAKYKVQANLSGRSSTARKKWAAFADTKIGKFTKGVTKKIKHVIYGTSTGVKHLHRSIGQRCHFTRESIRRR